MTDWYVFSGCTGTGAGTSWSNAMTHVIFAATSAAAGDRIFVASNHSESGANGITITFPGTASNPNLMMSVNQGGSVPPVGADYLPGAFLASNNNITFSKSAQIWGFTLVPLTGANVVCSPSAGIQYHRDGSYSTTNTTFSLCNAAGDQVIWENTTASFTNAATTINVNYGLFEWRNTKTPFTNVTPTTAFKAGNNTQPASLWAHGLDLSSLGSGHNLVDVTNLTAPFIIDNCNISASVAPFVNAWPSNFASVQIINCSNSGTPSNNSWHTYAGSITTETTVTLVSGANDGVTTISHKFSSTGTATIFNPLQGQPIGVWVSTSGNNIATLELITPTSFTNGNCWITVEALNTTSAPISTFTTNEISNPLVAVAPLSASSASWNSSPPTPTKYHLQCAFSTSMAGMVYVTPYVGKASALVYFNPAVTLTS